ncbi:hypothetical protein ACYPKM_03520 [Pseudomonas aeruginosa]
MSKLQSVMKYLSKSFGPEGEWSAVLLDEAKFEKLTAEALKAAPVVEAVKDYLKGVTETMPLFLAMLVHTRAGREFVIENVEQRGMPVSLLYRNMILDGGHIRSIKREYLLRDKVEEGGGLWEPEWEDLMRVYDPALVLSGFLESLVRRARSTHGLDNVLIHIKSDRLDALMKRKPETFDVELAELPAGLVAKARETGYWGDVVVALSVKYCRQDQVVLKMLGASQKSKVAV